eukprot:GILJ01004453.1.p1 GENE.GILJ01004453.1~~GILJ01004453.1.p1  ORF type:complete len:477 (+),score=71.66 GILJ01004453.1:51-1481(+)
MTDTSTKLRRASHLANQGFINPAQKAILKERILHGDAAVDALLEAGPELLRPEYIDRILSPQASRLRKASLLAREGMIDEQTKGAIKDMIVQGDERIARALDTGDALALKSIITGKRSSFDFDIPLDRAANKRERTSSFDIFGIELQRNNRRMRTASLDIWADWENSLPNVELTTVPEFEFTSDLSSPELENMTPPQALPDFDLNSQVFGGAPAFDNSVMLKQEPDAFDNNTGSYGTSFYAIKQEYEDLPSGFELGTQDYDDEEGIPDMYSSSGMNGIVSPPVSMPVNGYQTGSTMRAGNTVTAYHPSYNVNGSGPVGRVSVQPSMSYQSSSVKPPVPQFSAPRAPIQFPPGISIPALSGKHNNGPSSNMGSAAPRPPPNSMSSSNTMPVNVVASSLFNNTGVDLQRKVGAYTIEERQRKIEKYLRKKANRNFKKKVEYDVRKRVADNRVRVKGRFVKKAEEDRILNTVIPMATWC